MAWIKATDKYPEDWQLCRIVGTNKKFPAMFATHVIADFAGKTYRKDQIEWLLESEHSFSIEDMVKSFHEGADNSPVEVGDYANIFNKFLKREYNIDIN